MNKHVYLWRKSYQNEFNFGSIGSLHTLTISELAPSPLGLEKNRKTFFDFLSSGLGNNVSLFRLRRFGEVGAGLGSPVAGVEIGTG